ncbi:MAG: hypothetical protein AABX98_01375, partial [Nanoarchaeota archaeon]
MEELDRIIGEIEKDSGRIPRIVTFILGKYPLWNQEVYSEDYGGLTEGGLVHGFLSPYHYQYSDTPNLYSVAKLFFGKEEIVIDEMREQLRTEFQDYLNMCRLLGHTNTSNSFLTDQDTVAQQLGDVLTSDQAKEYALTGMIQYQGNGRGV